MKHLPSATLAATVAAVTVLSPLLSAAPKLSSVWKSPDAASVSFAGKKVAALIISEDQTLRISGEEALARELQGHGLLQAVATYRIAPKEELASGDRAKTWFENAKVEGVVALRPVKKETREKYTPAMWSSPYYSSFWGYYGYGWGNAYIPGYIENETVVVVETTIYSVPLNKLLWAAVSETKDPKTLQKFMDDLLKETVKQLQKQGLAQNLKKK